MKRVWLGIFAAVLMSAGVAPARVWYVDTSATGEAFGDTWADAFTTLSEAITFSVSGDEVWVAKGVYKPASQAGFSLSKNNFRIYGGFLSGMTNISQRNWNANLTVISGDINNDDTPGFSNRIDNAYHLFAGSSASSNLLDGLVLRGGNANFDGDPTTSDNQGGALRLESMTSFSAKNCAFVDNEAVAGGAVYTRDLQASALFENCVFSGNLSLSTNNVGGGGAFAGRRGTGIGRPALQVLLNRCIFTGNRAPDSMGGVLNATTLNGSMMSANATNSLFAGNEASTNWAGGAFYFRNVEESPVIMNSTFFGNFPDAVAVQNSTNIVINSIVWGNASDIYPVGPGSDSLVSYSDVGKARFGTNSLNHNINQEPLFAYTESGTWSAAATYNKLTGQTVLTNASANWTNNAHAGRTVQVNTNRVAHFAVFTNSVKSLTVWGDATAGGSGAAYTICDFNLASNSPCGRVATASNAPAVDIKMASRPQGLGYDMGAYEISGMEADPPTNQPPVGNSIWYVNGSASGANNGTNWANAFTTVTAAFQNLNLQAGDQIWVAQGVYKTPAGRTNSFNVPSRVQVYGGYAAGTTNRSWKTNLTVLSGDSDSNDAANFAGRTNNAYHVLYAGYIKETVLDGFVVRGGYADDSALTGNGQGGGLYAESCTNLTVRYCAFVDNAAGAGGALFTRDLDSSLAVDDCVFSGNLSLDNNTTDGGGGAVAGRRSAEKPAVQMVGTRCVFSANKAPNARGGALYSTTISGTRYTANFTNSLFAGNSASTNYGGGALYYRDSDASPVQMNSTFFDNFPDAIITQSSTNILINSIVWNNGGDLTSVNAGGVHDVTYTDTSKFKYGTNSLNHNLNFEPLFIHEEGGTWSGNASYNASLGVTVLTNASAGWVVNDHAGRTVKVAGSPQSHFYILSSAAKSVTVWGDATAGAASSAYTIYDFNLSSNSPCLSVATSSNAPVVDIQMTSRPQGLGYDMGAFEFVGTEAPPVTNPPPGSGIWYVNAVAAGSNNGLTWANAFTNLQAALANPELATSNEIWVAQGVYRPGTNRIDVFGLRNRVAVYGGFTNGMASKASRNWKLYRAVLSGDLDKNDTANFANRAGNAYHVIDASYVADAVLDGFVVCGGSADGATPADRGGALYAEGSSNLVVRNCSFADNAAVGGGAVFISEVLSPVSFEDCVFGGNVATEFDNINYGGGAISGLRRNPTSATLLFQAERCVFAGNKAPNSRGGVFNSPTISGSQASGHFTNCLMVGNSASITNGGGALYLKGILERVNLNSCTFAGNYPDAMSLRQATNFLVNTIVWSNSPNEIGGYTLGDAQVLARYSDVNIPEFTNSLGCMQQNPMWQSSTGTWSGVPAYDRNSGMTVLQGAGWTAKALVGSVVKPSSGSPSQFYIVDNTATTLTVLGDATSGTSGMSYVIYNYHLVNGSPCVNSGRSTGVPLVDLDLVTRPQEAAYDMGAYEYKPSGIVPSWWWALYPSIAQDELADPDGDGLTNLDEYKGGSDPTDKYSVFEIGDVDVTTNSLNIIRWLSLSNRVYSVKIGSVVGSTFTSLVTSLGATPPMNTYTDAVARPNPTFYRVGVDLLP